jgi:hypothetical protein
MWLAVLRRPVISQAHWQRQPTGNTQLEQIGSMLHEKKPSPTWCAAVALSHSEQCRMWQIKFKRARSCKGQTSISIGILACSHPPYHLRRA